MSGKKLTPDEIEELGGRSRTEPLNVVSPVLRAAKPTDDEHQIGVLGLVRRRVVHVGNAPGKLESDGDFARIVGTDYGMAWPLEIRELLAVDRPVAVSGESDMDPFRLGPRAVATSIQFLDGYH